MQNYTKTLIPISIILIIGIILYGVYNLNNKNYNNIKEDTRTYLVYTKSNDDSDDYKKIIPHVNIKGSFGKAINKDINDYLKNYQEKNINITYEYSLSGKVLSLIIKVEDHQYAESATLVSVRSYNINLETQELLSNQAVFDLFSISDTDVSNQIKNYLIMQYNDLIRSKELNSYECNYDCFLERRNIKDYLNKAEVFIKEGKLIVYEPMVFINETSDSKYSFEIE